MERAGPLRGLRILELEGLGPGPHGAMLLADLGADVLTVLRSTGVELVLPRPENLAPSVRSKAALRLDLKSSADLALFLDLVERADVVIDPYRPGVVERLGIGPDVCLARNPALVFARISGWGQHGPLSEEAGHDLNYLALSGVLHALGRAGQPPTTPPGLIADFGGGSLYLALGILAASWEARRTGRGQVVDVAMLDGVTSLAAQYYPMSSAGLWNEERGTNYLDSGAPFYDVYACSDSKFVAVGALEKRFYSCFVQGLGIAEASLPDRDDRANWASLRAVFAGHLAERSRDEWAEHYAGTDACVTPVLTFTEARAHPHLQARQAFLDVDGAPQPSPAPRFMGTPAADPTPRVIYDDLDKLPDGWGPTSLGEPV